MEQIIIPKQFLQKALDGKITVSAKEGGRSKMKQLICIVCPKGCHLNVDEENGYSVTGNGCLRGVEYAKKELTHPTRVVTSTVKIKGASHSRCPVKTDRDIPKELIFQAMALLNDVELVSPVKLGTVACANILGTDANFVVTKSM
jgi:CxxC motif-containing protein